MKKNNFLFIYDIICSACIFSILAIYIFDFKADYWLLLKGLVYGVILSLVIKWPKNTNSRSG